MGFLTLNVLLYIVQIHGLGRFLIHTYDVLYVDIHLGFIFRKKKSITINKSQNLQKQK